MLPSALPAVPAGENIPCSLYMYVFNSPLSLLVSYSITSKSALSVPRVSMTSCNMSNSPHIILI